MATTLKQRIAQNDILLAVAVVAAVWLLLKAHVVFFIVFAGLILTLALRPFVVALERWRFPRFIAVIIPLAVILGLGATAVAYLVPIVVHQSEEIGRNLPQIVEATGHLLGRHLDVNQLQSYLSSSQGQLQGFGKTAIQLTGNGIEILIGLVAMIFISIYWLWDYDNIRRFILTKLPSKQTEPKVALIELRLGSWVRGQLILSVVIGLLAAAAYVIIGLPFAIALGIFAAVMEIIPTIGPFLGIIPAVAVALTISLQMTLAVTVIYIVIQFLESHLLAPQIMAKVVGLHPLTIIISLLLGGTLGGVLGALFAIPLVLFGLSIFEPVQAAGHK